MTTVPPADTTPGMRRRQLAIYRAMTPERRVELALTMSEARAVALAGIRRRHPGMSEADVVAELVRILHGRRIR